MRRATNYMQHLERRLLLAIDVDPSFGDNGIATIDTGVSGYHGTVMVRELAGGKVLAVAGVGAAPNISAALARFNADGSPDTTFGGVDGVVLIPIGERVADAVLQPDGKAVIVGQRDNKLLVARVTTDGALDATFAGDGVAEMTIASATNQTFTADGAALSSDGNISASGSLRDGADGHIVLARFTPAGLPDMNFSGDGLLVHDRPGVVDFAKVSTNLFIAAREDGAAVVGRFTPDGVLDEKFYDAGGFRPLQQRPGDGVPFAITDPANRFHAVAGGQGYIFRFDGFGNSDTSFSGDGYADLPAGVGLNNRVQELDVDGRDRVVAVVENGVVRVLSDGSLDPAFGINGFVRIERMVSSAIDITSTDSNLILVGGGAVPAGSTAVIAVARLAQRPGASLNSDGVLVVSGDGSDDSIVLDVSGGQARLNLNGTVTTYALADVTGFDVDTGAGDDTITLAIDVPATVRAGVGNDAITTADGDDFIEAGEGDNNVATGAGIDSITTGSGRDTVVSGDGNDDVRTGAGDDSITTGDGDDFIEAGPGAATIFSNGGNDRVVANTGNDSIDGGAGNDYIRAGAGDDTVTGGEGNDRLCAGDGDNLVFGGTGNDYVRAGSGRDTLWGEIGYDEIRAGFGDDYVNGGAGKDRIFGQQGDDVLYGGRGNDAIHGGPGADLLKGLDGNDKLFADDKAADTLDGGGGDDLAAVDEALDLVLRIEATP
jgi:uncharacterized delta-60 repeat protein